MPALTNLLLLPTLSITNKLPPCTSSRRDKPIKRLRSVIKRQQRRANAKLNWKTIWTQTGVAHTCVCGARQIAGAHLHSPIFAHLVHYVGTRGRVVGGDASALQGIRCWLLRQRRCLAPADNPCGHADTGIVVGLRGRQARDLYARVELHLHFEFDQRNVVEHVRFIVEFVLYIEESISESILHLLFFVCNTQRVDDLSAHLHERFGPLRDAIRAEGCRRWRLSPFRRTCPSRRCTWTRRWDRTDWCVSCTNRRCCRRWSWSCRRSSERPWELLNDRWECRRSWSSRWASSSWWRSCCYPRAHRRDWPLQSSWRQCKLPTATHPHQRPRRPRYAGRWPPATAATSCCMSGHTLQQRWVVMSCCVNKNITRLCGNVTMYMFTLIYLAHISFQQSRMDTLCWTHSQWTRRPTTRATCWAPQCRQSTHRTRSSHCWCTCAKSTVLQ